MKLRERVTNPLPILIFTIFVDLLGFGILIPVVPQLLANPASPYYLLSGGIPVSTGYILLGFLLGVFPLAQFIAAPILGQLSDAYGRKKILAIALFGTCLSYILFGYGILLQSIPLLFIARAFDGITGGNISVAQASIADVTLPQDRTKNFGLIGAAFGCGFIIGPYLGGKLSDPSVVSWFSATTPFWFASVLSFLNVVSLFFFLKETHATPTYSRDIVWAKATGNIIKALNFRSLRPLFLTSFLFQGGFAFYATFFSVFLINKFGFTQGNIGDWFAYVGVWIAFSHIVVVRLAARRFREYQILRVSLFAAGILMMLFFLPDHWWGLLFVAPLYAMANGLSFSNITGLISKSSDSSIQGEVLGINASVQALAYSIPPILSGFIAARLTPETPIVVASLVIILSGMVFITFYRPYARILGMT
ncbi:MAG: hypothetical protein A3A28_05100 [Candidatus Sungbacteria bacterium RIFCSPLOWO2_01_FULL_47_32]|uniref:Major facilitator superfamily (MFS) profile domain-containing protein n=1 Tax=Candidatus Sungbacteria bacterium RIFCSPHIGHO2_01_FULL_47_32 TaxID=1802264 RepID=A0A1G2K5B8_9BACT|nr:MAG: Tetracycline resistance protein, class E [Parcubacteria group bacterium GW2011_GWA2_47_10]OGZ94617.1 MAG: hypothetical protein A2633_01205 [Candidatus Sungbacteria bacterium RIFCSPHIGHO2_01_FULL_47_32]OGZ98703.1 MAG: hypothetical protein A3D57_00245 [Candidatus Sungbacteria bacterium RIFCSPHIGHO2_02_FULL_46_12]OHA04853.1 MAG: hypothetical protein A3A28_05100 [Candidatus Sungbacteria bacterium RIFCSPLOWO2_01_FULL_47_32]